MQIVHARSSLAGLMLMLASCGGGADPEGSVPGGCTDGADNDGNSLFDCDDPSCFAAPACDDVDTDTDTDTDTEQDPGCSPGDCAAGEFCHRRECELIANRNWTIDVDFVRLTERDPDGSNWETAGLPDPHVCLFDGLGDREIACADTVWDTFSGDPGLVRSFTWPSNGICVLVWDDDTPSGFGFTFAGGICAETLDEFSMLARQGAFDGSAGDGVERLSFRLTPNF